MSVSAVLLPVAAYTNLSDSETWALAAYVRLLVRERPLSDFPPAWTATEDGPSHDPRPSSFK